MFFIGDGGVFSLVMFTLFEIESLSTAKAILEYAM